MSQMLPEGGEVMRRMACADPAPLSTPPQTHRSENKELLRQQLLSAKERQNTERQQDAKSKHVRSRQKNRWKLKFHHQALPQEYLDHYEQSLQKQAKIKQNNERPKETDKNIVSKEHFKVWTQKLAGTNNSATLVNPSQVSNAINMSAKSLKSDVKKKINAPSKIVTYDDLPYMGELTLNNSKPRRGRKPKKADICHLIYENYGTVVPGQPIPPVDNRSNLSMCFPLRGDAPAVPKTDIQNRIISSLLERKLSQETKRRLDAAHFVSPNDPMPEAPVTIAGPLHSDEEPLNLCIRDLHELKIQIQKKFGNIYSSIPEVKIEIDDEIKSDQANAISVIQRNTNVDNSLLDTSQNIETVMSPSETDKNANLYWPNSLPNALYMHPLAFQTQLMYYQRLAAAGQIPFPLPDQDSSTNSNSPANSPNIDETKNKLVLKEISELLEQKTPRQDEQQSPEPKLKRASPNPTQGPIKRKRSAIFIPQVPTKSNSTTPTTEVSICKFKFTGGSKPSLQEKKMLSVDSGGNFRYYNGTGNKGNKQTESRESNNQNKSMDQLARKIIPASSIAEDSNKQKKRKSRKSIQREKLEQTFKEKGFLIQTQQLQSAEGATYCKFRQLRKFTRYLFRSWKDYLPGELNERGEGRVPNDQPSVSAVNQELPAASEWG